MTKKAQVLMLSLWILAILSVLAVGIGHRVSMSLRLSRYQRDKLKGLYLANAGLKLAIAELEKDTNDYDALLESWADNEEVFKRIVLDDEQAEFATVSYVTTDENNSPKTIYGVADEERKLNINTAPKELLVELLEKKGVVNFLEIANNICAWRGDTGPDIIIPDYQDLGYTNKGKAFVNIAELMLVKDIDGSTYSELKSIVTVYGGNAGSNINTSTLEVLEIICIWAGTRLRKEGKGITDIQAKSLALKINDCRDGFDNMLGTQDDTPFTDVSQIITKLNEFKELSSEERELINKIMNDPQARFKVKSENFLIEVIGNAGTIKSKISSVYSGQDAKNILYWHES